MLSSLPWASADLSQQTKKQQQQQQKRKRTKEKKKEEEKEEGEEEEEEMKMGRVLWNGEREGGWRRGLQLRKITAFIVVL